MSNARKLHDLDQQIMAVRDAQAQLVRLEEFLLSSKKALTGELQGTYGSVMAGVGVSNEEVQARVSHANNLVERWGKKQ